MRQNFLQVKRVPINTSLVRDVPLGQRVRERSTITGDNISSVVLDTSKSNVSNTRSGLRVVKVRI